MAAMSILGELIQAVTERSRTLFDRVLGSGAAGEGGPILPLARDLVSHRGEASGVALANLILERYLGSGEADRRVFLAAVAREFDPDDAALAAAIEAYRAAPDGATLRALHQAAEPSSLELIRRLNLAPGGTRALVRMREDLLRARPGDAALGGLDADFLHLFASWFNRGFLVLRPIDWTTPAHILEKIIRYEAVHEISGWDDLRRRIAPADRRCFAFFHPALADEPLIFVEVALTRTVPGEIAPILAEDRTPLTEGEANTAVFYSISNCQEGLRGVSFGNFLIKQVASDLQRDVPSLKTFVTLSPVPGLRRWIGRLRAAEDEAARRTAETLRAELAAVETLEAEGWPADKSALDALQGALCRLAATYFLRARAPSGRALDPVAHFHLGNGARLDRLNPGADLTAKGMGESFGLMVNYRYDLDAIETNHEAYAEQGEIVAATAIRRLVRGDAPPRDAVPAEG